MLDALCGGETEPERLASLVAPTVRASQVQLVAALPADWREHHRFLLQELPHLIDGQTRSLPRLEQELERRLAPFKEQIECCDQITGVSREVIQGLMAQGGTDLSRFADAGHLSSWAGVCPGHQDSAGKRLSGKTRHANRYVRTTLVQAAHGGRRSKSYLGERYRRLQKRRGRKRAALAVAHTLLVIYYQLMKPGEPDHEKGEGFFPQTNLKRVEHGLVRRLEQLGYQVSRTGPPAP